MSTLNQLALKALYRLNDSVEKAWTRAEITRYIARGAEQFALSSKCAWGISTIPLKVNISVYTLPNTVLSSGIQRVSWNNLQLNPLYAYDIEREFPDYETATGQPVAFTLDKDGFRRIRLVNVPNAEAVALGPLSIESWQPGTIYTSQTAGTVNLSTRQERYVLDYAMALAYAREGPGQDLKMSKHYDDRFALGVSRAKLHMSRIYSNQHRALGVGALSLLKEGYRQTELPRLPYNIVPIERRGRGPRMS